MIVTLTLNPCLDRYITVAGLVPGETNRSGPVAVYAGGKGIDVARAVHEMGVPVVALGLIGGHDGRVLARLIEDEGVPARFVHIQQETRVCYIINDTGTGQQLRISTPGPSVQPADLARLLAEVHLLKPSLLVCGGTAPPGLPDDVYAGIIRDMRGHGVRAALDSSGAFLREGVAAGPYLIKPNVAEAAELLGRALDTEADILQAAREIQAAGVEIVVISRGAEGLIAVGPGRAVKAVPPPVAVVSEVGAGDCAVAGLALGLDAGKNLLEASRLAVAMGTAAVLQPGTGLAQRADVERLLPQVKVGLLAAG